MSYTVPRLLPEYYNILSVFSLCPSPAEAAFLKAPPAHGRLCVQSIPSSSFSVICMLCKLKTSSDYMV